MTSTTRFNRVIYALSACLISTALASCGSGGQDQVTEVAPVAPTFKGELRLVAGHIGGPGNLDGVGSDARFNAPAAVAYDVSGNLFVADLGNGLVRKVTPTGVVSTVRNAPLASDIALDATGNVYVVSGENIVKVSTDGVSTVLATFSTRIIDPYGGCKAGSCGSLPIPAGLAVDSQGNVYTSISTYGTPRKTVVKISSSGAVSNVGTFPKPVKKMLAEKTGALVALIGDENEIVRIDASGTVMPVVAPVDFPGTFVTMYTLADTRENHTFINIAFDHNGKLCVLDRDKSGFDRLIQFGDNGLPYAVVGIPAVKDASDNGFEISGPLGKGIAIDNNGRVAFTHADIIRTVNRLEPFGNFSALAGSPAVYGHADGSGTSTKFSGGRLPVDVDNLGNIWVAEPDDFTVRKIIPAGNEFTIGTKRQGTANGTTRTGEDASFWAPMSVAVNARTGGAWVSDLFYQPTTPAQPMTTVRNVASYGTVTTGFNFPGATWEDSGMRIFNPLVIASDKVGNLYVVDSSSSVIRKFSPDGTASTAGFLHGEWYTLGPVVYSTRRAMTVDRAGNMYILSDANVYSSTPAQIYKVTPGSTQTHLAGGGVGNVDGKGVDAKFNQPSAITVDDVGNLYVADTGNDSIRKVSPDGTVTTLIRGTGKGIRLGMSPNLYRPTGLAYQAPNTLVITVPGAVLKYQ